MANKTWTATDLRMDRLTLSRDGATTLRLERRYTFVDASGAELTHIAGGRLVREVAFTSLPTNIQQALQAIDVYTKQQALAEEGMG
jgi:hypothetical protein